MATSFPVYVKPGELGVEELPTSEPATATLITDEDGNGCAGVLIRGVVGVIDSAGGKVTINVYSEETVEDAVQFYSVELDHTTLTTTSDTQAAGIPMFDSPYFTLTGDGDAEDKEYSVIFYLQKITS